MFTHPLSNEGGLMKCVEEDEEDDCGETSNSDEGVARWTKPNTIAKTTIKATATKHLQSAFKAISPKKPV